MDQANMGLPASYASLVGGVVTLIELLKARFDVKWIDSKEPMAAFALTVIAGAVAKVAHFGFGDVVWGTHVTLLVTGGTLAAKIVHDYVLNLLTGKGVPKT